MHTIQVEIPNEDDINEAPKVDVEKENLANNSLENFPRKTALLPKPDE